MTLNKFKGKSNIIRHEGFDEVYCRGCGVLLARVRHEGGITKMTLLKTHRGEAVYIDIAVSHRLGGMIAIECEACKGYVSPAYQQMTLVLDDEQTRILDAMRKKSTIEG